MTRFDLMRPLPCRIVAVEVEALMLVNLSQKYRSLRAIVPLLLGLACPASADEPTLARLSFWGPPERMQDFAAIYDQRLLPVLRQRDLRPSVQQGRTTIDSVFSRLFEIDGPAEIDAVRRALRKDGGWQKALQAVAAEYGAAVDSSIFYTLDLYSTPVKTGRITDAGAGTRQGLWQSFNIQDGLSHSAITAIFQDRQGDLWIGTLFGGVTRYDGARFETFSVEEGLVSSMVKAIFEDREGHLWFACYNGVSRYDGARFANFNAVDGLPTIAPGMRVNIVQDRDGNLWFGSSAWLTRFDGQTFTRVTARDGLAADGVKAIFQDQNRHLWFATEKGVSRYDGKQFITFTEDDGLPGENVVSIAEDDDGHLWFATKEGFIARYDGHDFATFAIRDHRDDFSPNALAMVFDRQGHLWIGTNSGVVRYDGREFVNFTVEDGLAGNQIEAILEDREGHLWIGSRSGGMSRYDGAQFTHFTTRDGLPSSYIYDVVQDRQGNLWFGTSGGTVRYDGQNFTTFTTEDGLGANRVWDVFADSRGNLWFGAANLADRSVTRYDGREFKIFTRADGLAGNSGGPIYEDRADNMWFGLAEGGVIRYDGRASKTFTLDDGLAGNKVSAICQDRAGNMWFGTLFDGVVRYDGSEFKTFTPDDGLAGIWVQAIYQDRAGNMWFGGLGGVSRYDGERFLSFSVDDGLPPGVVFSIFEDRRGHLWLSVFGAGAVRYDGRVFQTLSRRDGLTDNGVHAIIQDRHGAMWIATDGGITRYLSSETPPSIFLKEVVADRTYGAIETLELPSTQAFVRFAFQGQSFSTRPEQMVYVFRLQGYDEDWRQTRQNQVEYRDLPAGDYVFEVKAVDRDLNYSPEPATVHLRVHPPYLQLALLCGLGLALVGLVVASGYGIKRRRERDRLQRDRDQAREQLAREHRQRVEVQPHDIEQWTLDDFVEQSPGMRLLFDEIGRRQAEDDSQVLITGEAGTGKELMARAIHAGSSRSSGNFVAVRCALLPADMTQMEQRTKALSQLFGYLEEAFGKGNRTQDGYVQQAAGGTLFFDEIGLVPLPLQTHLLRVLTQEEVRRVGTEQTERIDLRVLAATSMDMAVQVASGAFHAEWYEYLAAHRLAVPPLRERPEDIARLAQHFAQASIQKIEQTEVPLEAAVVEQLQSYDYPGNVRELKTIIERALIESGGRSIGVEHLHLPS